MSYNATQFRDLIERILLSLDEQLTSPAAVDLLLGTAAVESDFGHYLRQTKGPALGAFQMEPATFNWLRLKYGFRYIELKEREVWELETDLRLAIIMARLKYRSIISPIPSAGDIPAMAAYWNQYYNGNPDKGTDQDFIAKYAKYVTA